MVDMQAPLAVATEGLNIPSAPGMALSTPVMSAPAAILPAASTALSVNAAQPAIQLNPDQIAEKWGHPNGLTNHPEPQQVIVTPFLCYGVGITSNGCSCVLRLDMGSYSQNRFRKA